jgi:hypothetical protein
VHPIDPATSVIRSGGIAEKRSTLDASTITASTDAFFAEDSPRRCV